MASIAVRPSTLDLFWAKVDTSGEGCWIWTAYTDPFGYGKFHARIGGKSTQWLAHRFSFELANGPIPEGLVVDHVCHNKSCVNPAHLRAVTQKQNSEHRSGPTYATKSGVRGVRRSQSGKRWVASMGHNREFVYLGTYDTIAEAEAVVLAKRLELFTHNDLDRTPGP